MRKQPGGHSSPKVPALDTDFPKAPAPDTDSPQAPAPGTDSQLLHTCLVVVVAVLLEEELESVALHMLVFSSFQGLQQQVVEATRTIKKEQLKHPVERCLHPMLV